ncbi:MAG: 16S rRNA (cytosine(1402)-N(4))-methyltransferase RsmH [Candidatus Komeilibacteria bacterium]|nr:16S rRNA (cytosine(1402)-N(4))-methyltransferase RsmH [Candidatus Komeilibacteria bacterium]
MAYFHQPVLLNEVLQYLDPQPNQNFIDGTVGGAGHSAAILERAKPDGILIGLDRDPKAIEAARNNLKKFGSRAILVQENYSNINQVIEKIKNKYDAGRSLQFSAILLDLGLSSAQVSSEDERGFSFKTKQVLDMRFGPETELTAAEILNHWPEAELKRIFKEYGEERHAGLIARQIILYRKEQLINFTEQLVEVISQIYDREHYKTNPATKIFQALRIAVNDELNNLTLALPKLLSVLPAGGRLAVISFHSLEDRLVKNFFQTEAKDCLCAKELPICVCGHHKSVKILTKKPITAQAEEIRNNPRSRSAHLRVGQKL